MIDVNDELDALTVAAEVAREAEEDARRASRDAQRLVEEKRAALKQAYTCGDEALIKSARTAFERAERDAGAGALAARIEGTREAVRQAELTLTAFMNENYRDLVEQLRPRAEASVAAIRRRADDLAAAVAEWHAIDQEVGRLTRTLQWFDPRQRMPRDPFDGILGVLDEFRLRELPAPMPRSMESPAEAEQARVEQQAEQEAGRAASVDPAAFWAA